MRDVRPLLISRRSLRARDRNSPSIMSLQSLTSQRSPSSIRVKRLLSVTISLSMVISPVYKYFILSPAFYHVATESDKPKVTVQHKGEEAIVCDDISVDGLKKCHREHP
mmetsp:Transcript_4008/g.3878  ORF Transcript_4008/g.3878 Transcript_4008/m.3878 type:complete len:109 (+) Transcript_4008:285-611(+)